MKIFNLLENTAPFDPPKSFWIWFCVIIAITFIPWIALLIYTIVLKYRVRVFSNGHLYKTYMLKANEPIVIECPTREGYEVEGLYRDDTFMLPLEYKVMPKKNLKVYIKWRKIGAQDNLEVENETELQ